MPVRELGPIESGGSQLVPFSGPKPISDRRHIRDFGRQRPRDPAETDSPQEGNGFELSVPREIGFVSTGFRQGLAETGYVEGQNVSTDIRQIPGGFGQGSRLWPA